MLYIFGGDSHSRQFAPKFAGSFSNTVFSGATIVGLANERSHLGHGKVIRHLVNTPMQRTIFLMFGNVDIDFRFYKQCHKDPNTSFSEFLARCVSSYNQFLSRLIEDVGNDSSLRGIVVLGAQATPLSDEHFVRTTAAEAKMLPEELRSIEDVIDISWSARIQRAIDLNDSMQNGVLSHSLISFRRIDHKMVTASGAIRPEMLGPYPRDHHASTGQTLRLWKETLKDLILPYEMQVQRAMRKQTA